VTEGQASISADILARYAADAAREAVGVRGLVGRRGAKISDSAGDVSVEIRLELEWGTSIPEVGQDVQSRVGEYLARMAGVRPHSVEVVVDRIGFPP
jgi:uncharacterized alkaline shock family protein YloU